MKKTGQQTRFRDDLRRLLLFYSLLPVLSAVLLLIVFLGYIPLQNVVHGTADNLRLAWDAFGQEWQSLQNELLSLQSQLDLDAFRSSVNYQAAVKSRIYQFINQGGYLGRSSFFWTLMKTWSFPHRQTKQCAKACKTAFIGGWSTTYPPRPEKWPWWWRVRRSA